MAEAPAMPLWTDAYLGDTMHLSTFEHGAYLLLLMTMWRAGGTLKNDPKLLRKYTRMTAGQWRKSGPTLMEFFQIQGDEITQGRLSDELSRVRSLSKRQSSNARAKYRKTNKVNGATAPEWESQTPAPIPIPITISSKEDNPPNNPPIRTKHVYSPEFEEFWKAYPAKGRVAKPQCSNKFESRLKAGDFSVGEIMAAVRRYGTSDQVSKGFVCNLQTWLNQERWLHDYAEPENVFTAAIDKFVAGRT